MTTPEADAALFESITALIQEHERSNRRERRDTQRYPFSCVQLVAPLVGSELPPQESFRQVLCHDLSPNGFSFSTSEKPQTSRLVVALGRLPAIQFFVAEIARMTIVESPQGNQYRVGCRLLQRLSSDGKPAFAAT